MDAETVETIAPRIVVSEGSPDGHVGSILDVHHQRVLFPEECFSPNFMPFVSNSDFGCANFDLSSVHLWNNATEQNYFLSDKLRCARVGKLTTKRNRQHRNRIPALIATHQEKRLRQAASSGNLEDVKKIISSNSDLNLNAADDKKRTALHFSSAIGADDIVHALLQNGASPNVKDHCGNSPLHLAACTSHIRVVTLLLHYGGDVTALDRAGKTPLHVALSHLELFPKHVEKGRWETSRRKAEVKEIASLLREYVSQRGTANEKEHVSSVLERLARSTTDIEIDEVGELLTNFTKMALDNHLKKSRQTCT